MARWVRRTCFRAKGRMSVSLFSGTLFRRGRRERDGGPSDCRSDSMPPGRVEDFFSGGAWGRISASECFVGGFSDHVWPCVGGCAFVLFDFLSSALEEGRGKEEERKACSVGASNERRRTVRSRSLASCSPYPAFNRSRSQLSVLSLLRSRTHTHQRLCRSSHDLCRSSSTVHARPAARCVSSALLLLSLAFVSLNGSHHPRRHPPSVR